jgi:hypothetical protein
MEDHEYDRVEISGFLEDEDTKDDSAELAD